jgi:hypothetical protein
MELQIWYCDECILEEILKDKPDYKLERWGNMPIWFEYTSKTKKKLCVVAGDSHIESVCLEHLFRKEIWDG